METIELAEANGDSKGVRPSLMRVLADAGVAREEELQLAFAEAMGTGERFGEVVLRHGWLDEEGLAGALARQRGLSHLADAEVDHDAVVLLGGAAVAAELSACPIRSADGRLLVAVADPSDARFTAVSTAIRAEPEFAIVTAPVLERLIGHAAETANAAKRTAAEAQAARVADDEEPEASLRLLDHELEQTTAHLIRLRERVGEFVAQLSEANEVSNERIRTLEAEVSSQKQRIVAARRKLIEVGDSLDG